MTKCSKCGSPAAGMFPDPDILTNYKIKVRGLEKRFITHLYKEGKAYCADHLEEIRKEVLIMFSP